MSAVYPPGPAEVPANLTEPAGAYRRHAWLAVGGLLLFAAAYCALTGWFGWTAWRLFAGIADSGGDNLLATLVAGGCAAFLAVFMLKALVFVKRGAAVEDIEVTPQDQPALFDFLHRLAQDTGAPRPHRVFLSGRVNAAVFYDLSIANLLIPSRKNLEIGLGLVNVLTLGELKAVLAHELGHFAQKSMAVGRWVYIAQQVAGHIVARRDALDTFLARLSGIDIRIAWIGWVLRIIVWSIRSLVDLLFRLVLIAQRALSREMEFQADLVAVSVTGSDALIHALHKLGAADDAWDRTLGFAGSELQEGRGVKDLFAIQLHIIDKLRSLLGDANYGAAPRVPPDEAQTHRVFKAALAAPPRMWATHPSNADREANAKRRYIRADIDERSAWMLFKDPQQLRERVSLHMARSARTEFQPVEISESLAKLEQQYARTFFNAQYRGAYLGRSIVRHARAVTELYGVPPPADQVVRELDALYPESLSDDIERLRTLEEERQMLIALREGFLTAPGGVIRHRGTEMSRKALPAAIEAVERELAACAQIVRDHDRRCRTTHLAAAQAFGEDWAKYLRGLLELLHYADHVDANLMDAHGLLSHTVAVATADGKVSQSELDDILHAADTTYAALKDIHDAVEQVIPDRTVLGRMRVESWPAALEKLALPPPQQSNIGEWLNAVTSWIRSTSSSLGSLRLAALEQLLAAETQVALLTRKGMKPTAAPPASVVPREYRLLTPGSERPREAQLTAWDKFQLATGVLPTIARFAVAAAIIGAVLLVASGR
ncbi:MAG TPA: M48 family metallopeptidase [Steroidobacteraceae bacterium]|nr:M48 family metallopeptidase [Steroidobacteraceae bacterium]